MRVGEPLVGAHARHQSRQEAAAAEHRVHQVGRDALGIAARDALVAERICACPRSGRSTITTRRAGGVGFGGGGPGRVPSPRARRRSARAAASSASSARRRRRRRTRSTARGVNRRDRGRRAAPRVELRATLAGLAVRADPVAMAVVEHPRELLRPRARAVRPSPARSPPAARRARGRPRPASKRGRSTTSASTSKSASASSREPRRRRPTPSPSRRSPRARRPSLRPRAPTRAHRDRPGAALHHVERQRCDARFRERFGTPRRAA